jgi:hypothetical protein
MRMESVRAAAAACAAVILSATLAACGGGGGERDPRPTRTLPATGPTQTARALTPTPTPQVGANPTLGNYIPAITPGNGQTVTQLDTQTRDPNRPRGVCFQADFKDLQETGLWFRMAFDGKEVTEQLVWIVSNREDPEGGRACYAPPQGFTIGRHQVAVSVRSPNNPNEPPRQLVAWTFDVSR